MRGDDPEAAREDRDATQVEESGGALEDLAEAETRVLPEEDKTAPPRASPSGAAPDRGLSPGTILFGEYEIVSVLGAGGMGEVYRARHRRLDEHRAIKVMHAELSRRRGASEFFYREAKALLAVRHPAVVHCHDLLSDDAGRVYLIMEMIEGIPLSQRLQHGPLPVDEVAVLGARVAHGLAAAHRKGVIHRDLSPDNIVLPDGRVQDAKIIDFGIAKLLEQGEGTIVDGFKGKLSYASPEQLGFFGAKIDGRSDLYSLGLVLVAAALGRPMPMGTTVMEAVDARRAFGGVPQSIPAPLRAAIEPLLALDPEARPRQVERLFVVPAGFESTTGAGALVGPTGTQVLAGSRPASALGVPARAAPDSTRTSTAPNRLPWLIAVAAVAIALGTAWLYATRTEPTGAIADTAVAVSPPATAEGTATATSAQAAPAAAPLAQGEAAAVEARPNPEPALEAAAPAAPKPPEKRVAAVSKPAASTPRALSAENRLKIVGMLTNAKLALADGRLMTPAGDNAYDRYRSVLRLEPGNASAKSGLRAIAAAFVERANAAIDAGDASAARDHLRRARQADSGHPGIRAAEARITGG